MYRQYRRRVPTKAAAHKFVEWVNNSIAANYHREEKTEDIKEIVFLAETLFLYLMLHQVGWK